MLKRILTFILILISLLVFFLYPRDLEYQGADMSNLTVSIENGSQLSIRGNVQLNLYNPNFVKLKIVKSVIRVEIFEGAPLINLTSTDEVTFKPKNDGEYFMNMDTHVPLSFSGVSYFWSILRECVLENSIQGARIKKGTVHVDHFLFEGQVELDSTKILTIPCTNIF